MQQDEGEISSGAEIWIVKQIEKWKLKHFFKLSVVIDK